MKKKQEKKGINLAYSAAESFEINLMFKELLKNHKVKDVYIQVDYNWSTVAPEELSSTIWLPYLKEPYIYSQFINYNSKYLYYRYVPMYRFMIKEGKLGVRNLIFSILNKEYKTINQMGYVPIDSGEIIQNDKNYSYTLRDTNNINFNEIIQLSKNNNVSLHFFTSPIYRFSGDNTLLNKYLPNYTDLSNSIKNKNSFKDNIHLNNKGAIEFTDLFIENYFKK
ncbi:MAG: hypothetical protein H6604_01000 [Flavobacteriales bacterium]|nr:hypothetical protein [Flavobacteriales bacterium]